jgi:hypothetical protein
LITLHLPPTTVRNAQVEGVTDPAELFDVAVAGPSVNALYYLTIPFQGTYVVITPVTGNPTSSGASNVYVYSSLSNITLMGDFIGGGIPLSQYEYQKPSQVLRVQHQTPQSPD